jgi:hypothetical protein
VLLKSDAVDCRHRTAGAGQLQSRTPFRLAVLKADMSCNARRDRLRSEPLLSSLTKGRDCDSLVLDAMRGEV